MSTTVSTPPPAHDSTHTTPAGRCPGTARTRIVTLLFFLAVSLLGTLIVLFVENHHLQVKQKQAGDITARFAYTIQDRLNRSLSATYALAALIRQGNGRIDHFEQLGSEMLPLYGGISSLQLAPDGIIRQIVPLRCELQAADAAIQGEHFAPQPSKWCESAFPWRMSAARA